MNDENAFSKQETHATYQIPTKRRDGQIWPFWFSLFIRNPWLICIDVDWSIQVKTYAYFERIFAGHDHSRKGFTFNNGALLPIPRPKPSQFFYMLLQGTVLLYLCFAIDSNYAYIAFPYGECNPRILWNLVRIGMHSFVCLRQQPGA